MKRYLFPQLFRNDGDAFFVKTEGGNNWLGHTSSNGDVQEMRISPELAKALREEAKRNDERYRQLTPQD